VKAVSAEHRPFGARTADFKSVERSFFCDVDALTADAGASKAKVWYASWVSELADPVGLPSCCVNSVEYAVQRLVVDSCVS
jgi:hypothetical protein